MAKVATAGVVVVIHSCNKGGSRGHNRADTTRRKPGRHATWFVAHNSFYNRLRSLLLKNTEQAESTSRWSLR